MLNITKTGCWQCKQQITFNNIEEGVRGDLLKRRSAPGRCDAVLRKLTVHIIFARIVELIRTLSFYLCMILQFPSGFLASSLAHDDVTCK